MDARIRLCGRLEVELAGERVEARLPGRQGPLVVAVLALGRPRPVTRDELIGVLWPAELPADPDEALSALLSKVRSVLGREVLAGRRELSLVLPDGAEVDVEDAFAAAERAEAAAARGDADAAWEAASSAAATSGRGFLIGLGGPWVDERRLEVEELRLRALELMGAAGIELGGERLPGAERAARELVRAAPLREAGHRLLMEALAARGEVAEALAAYERLRVLLRDELGMAPGDTVRALHERLLAGGETSGQATRFTARDGERPPLPAPLARSGGSAFLGRAPELKRMRERWAAARDARRSIVLLAGGPGIGKTRLAAEVARAAHADGTVLYGGCQEDALVAYQPFVEALRHHVRHTGAELPRELATLLPEATPGDAPAAQEDPDTSRYLMFEAVAERLADASREAPLLLVLDDLHWADRSTLQLLRHVVRGQEETGLMIVGTYRDAEIEPGHPLAELVADLRRSGSFDKLALEGLDQASVGTLIEEHAGRAAPSELTRTIRAETDGNPFFVGEMVRHLVESGVRLDASGSAGPAELGVPEGVKEVLGRRIARLSERARGVLGHAAVLGREFRFDVLSAMAEVDEETALGALEEALDARLVVEQEAAGPSYAFAHALVRETLYEGLSSARRQRMHARAAAAIEASTAADADARTAALAMHSRLAGSAGDPERAVEYSLRAGARARELFAWHEALAHFDGAHAIMARAGADAAGRARLLVGLSELCVAVGDMGRQIAYLEQALAAYGETGDDVRAAQVRSRLGHAHCLIDSVHAEHLDVGRAFEHLDSARRVLDGGPPRASRGHLETGFATARMYALEVDAGIEASRRAMDIAEQLGDELLWSAAAETYGWHSIVSGRLGEGFDVLDRAFELGDRHRRSFLAFMALNMSGQLTWGLGAPDEARAFFERPLGLDYVGRGSYRAELADALGRCHVSKGEIDAARALLADARPAWISHSLEPLVLLADGALDEAAALAERVLATSRRTGNRWDEWAAHHLAGRVLQLRQEPGAAAERLEQALAIVVEGRAAYFELWVRPDLARVRAELGQLDEAREHVERCGAILAEGEDWRGRAGIAAVAEGVVLAAEGRADEADARFAAAEETLREYGLAAELADCVQQRRGSRTPI